MIFRTALAFLFLVLSAVAGAQSLTPAQKVTLKAAILAEAPLAAAVAIRDDTAISVYCNTAANPAQKAWREAVPARDIFDATVLTEYIARSAAERQGYDLMLSMQTVDASRARIRSAVVDIFSGATNSTSRALVLNAMTENATWCEQKLGGTNATTDGISAWRRNWTGVLRPDEISNLLN